MKIIEVNYEKFLFLGNKICEQIKKTGILYDAVICPLRGGFFLSYYVSKHLDLPMKYIEISSYKGKQQSDFSFGIMPDLAPGKYLLCDDICDSGKTIEKIMEIYNHSEILVACLLSKKNMVNLIAGEYIENDSWTDFFWETM